MSYKDYFLVGGLPVKITALEVSASGTYIAPENTAYNPVVVSVSGALESKSVSYAENGSATVKPSDGKEGLSQVSVTVAVPSYMTTLESPYGAADGLYLMTAAYESDDEDEETDPVTAYVTGYCILADGAVSASYGDGTFAIDDTGEKPVLAWTPSVTATTVTCYYASRIVQ